MCFTCVESLEIVSLGVADRYETIALGMLALAFVALVTPYELAVMLPVPNPETLGDITGLYATNRLVDIFFVCDIVRQFTHSNLEQNHNCTS